MRKLFPLLFLAVAPVLGCGFLGIGESAPELSKGHWAGSAPVKLAEYQGKKMVALLFWAPESSSARAIQHFAGTAYRLRKMPVAFVSVGKGSADQVMKFPLFRQFGGIPVLADPDGRNQALFLRRENRLPQALLIGKDGKLLWRGAPGRLAAVINAVEKNRYDRKRVRYEDDFSAAFAGFVVKNDFKGALAFLEKELSNPLADPLEIVALQVGIHYRRLNSVEGALTAVHKAQERFPGQAPYYEMELKLLELGHREDLMEEFYLRLTKIFRKQPGVLLNFVNEVAAALEEKWEAEHVAITLGPQGMLLWGKGKAKHVPTRAREVFDVSGAGDTVTGTYTLALSSGAAPEQAAEIANLAAGVVVGKVGTAPITFNELKAACLADAEEK